MNDSAYSSDIMISFAATYLLHSTALLAACWIINRRIATTSHFLVERMWKLAAVLGLATAVVQVAGGAGFVIEVNSFKPAGPSSEPAMFRLPAELSATRSQAPSDSSRGSIRSMGLSGTVSDSPDNSFVDLSAARDGAVTRAPEEETARVVRTTSDFSKAPSEPDHQAQIDPAGKPHGRSAYAVAQSNRLAGIVPIVLQVAFGISAMCIALGPFLLAWRSLRLRREFSDASLLQDGPARHTLDRFLRRNRIRRHVRLLVSDRHDEPVTYGLLRWTIVLPVGTDAWLGRDELAALFAHEVAHLVRGDVYWLWAGRVLCTCLAFQPMNFIARRGWQQAAEYLCDDWAVQRGIHSLSLARCLTKIAEWRMVSQPCAAVLAAGGSKTTLVSRVERLVETRRPPDRWAKPQRRWLIHLAAMLCTAMLIVLAPRVSLSRMAIQSQHARSAFKQGIVASASGSPALGQLWEGLQAELMQLEADLDRANPLIKNTPRQPRVDALMKDIRQRTALLRVRRERITSSFEKESK